MRDGDVTTSQATQRAIRVRRELIAMALRRARPGSGSMLDFLRMRTWSEPSVNLHDLRTPFVIVGAVATNLYVPERPTQDIGILVAAMDASRLHAELVAAGFTRQGDLSIGGSGWESEAGRLDDIESAEPWARSALDAPNRSPTGLPVIALPYLILMKLQAAPTRDLGDLTRMLGFADEPTRNQVRDAVRRYRPQDVEDVESLILLGELELEPGQPSTDP